MIKKEWSEFQGYNGSLDSSFLTLPEASSASNITFYDGGIQTSKGNSLWGAWLTSTANHNRLFGYNDASGNQKIIGIIGSTQQIMVSTGAGTSQHLLYGVTKGTATFTTGITTVTFDTVNSAITTQIANGDFIKVSSQADSTYLSVTSTDSTSQLTLGSGYGSGCVQCTFSVRKIMALTVGSQYLAIAQENGQVIMSDGGTSTEIPMVWDGTNLYYNSTIPNSRVFVAHKKRIFSCGSISNPSGLAWSPVDNPNGSWDAAAIETVGGNDGAGEIVGCLSYVDNLIVFKRYGKIYVVYGNFGTAVGQPDSISEIPTSLGIGEIAYNGVVVHKGIIHILTTNGLYIFNGRTVVKSIKNFDDLIDPLAVKIHLNSTISPLATQEIFMQSFSDSLYINLDNKVAVVDPDNKMSVWDGLPDDFYGNFVSVSTNLYVGSQAQNRGGLLKLNQGYTVNGAATSSVKFTYTSNNEFFDYPEVDKNFIDFKIFYKVTAGTNTSNRMWFDYSIDGGAPTFTTSTIPSVFYSTTTLYSTGTIVGALKVDTIKVGRKGKSIQWRLREFGDSLGNTVYKVQGFAAPLSYR